MNGPAAPPSPAPALATAPWHALRRALDRDPAARVPFSVDGQPAGSVARAHLGALADTIAGLGLQAHWRVDGAGTGGAPGVACSAPADARTAQLAALNAELRGRGCIRAWRGEPYLLPTLDGRRALAVVERASARFWGSLTFGAHANGLVAAPSGTGTGTGGSGGHAGSRDSAVPAAPAIEAVWIARRAADKATDPGLLDNLVGAGVPAGQTPWDALQRECWEEAGLPAALAAAARPGGVWRTERDVPEGLHVEWVYAHDLLLPPGHQPWNPDGEVAGFACLPVGEALAAAAGPGMTVDAALVMLDAALRHRLLDAAARAALGAAAAALQVPAQDAAHAAALLAQAGNTALQFAIPSS